MLRTATKASHTYTIADEEVKENREKEREESEKKEEIRAKTKYKKSFRHAQRIQRTIHHSVGRQLSVLMETLFASNDKTTQPHYFEKRTNFENIFLTLNK